MDPSPRPRAVTIPNPCWYYCRSHSILHPTSVRCVDDAPLWLDVGALVVAERVVFVDNLSSRAKWITDQRKYPQNQGTWPDDCPPNQPAACSGYLARPEQEPFPFGWTTEGEFTEMEHANLVTRLDHEHAIVQAATANAEGAGLWDIGKGSIKTLHPPTHHHHSHHHAHDSSASSGQPPWHSSSSGFRAYEFEPSNALRVSDRDTPEEFHVPEVPDPHLDGVIVSVKRHHPNVDPKGQHDHDAAPNDEDEDEDTTTEVNDDATSPKDGMSTSRRHRQKKNDDDDDDDDDCAAAKV